MAERTKEEIRKLSAPLSLCLTPWDWLKKAQLLRDASNQLFVRFENDRLASRRKVRARTVVCDTHVRTNDSSSRRARRQCSHDAFRVRHRKFVEGPLRQHLEERKTAKDA
jgi:hypothetical protein